MGHHKGCKSADSPWSSWPALSTESWKYHQQHLSLSERPSSQGLYRPSSTVEEAGNGGLQGASPWPKGREGCSPVSCASTLYSPLMACCAGRSMCLAYPTPSYLIKLQDVCFPIASPPTLYLILYQLGGPPQAPWTSPWGFPGTRPAMPTLHLGLLSISLSGLDHIQGRCKLPSSKQRKADLPGWCLWGYTPGNTRAWDRPPTVLLMRPGIFLPSTLTPKSWMLVVGQGW